MGFYKNNNGNLELVAGGTNFAESPIGSIVPFGGTSEVVPSGWFLCDGRAISRTEYSVLFDIIGTNFGGGDSSTTFNIPDLRGEFLRGAGTNSHANQGDGGTVGEHQDATEFPIMNTRIGATGIVFESQATESTRGMITKSDKSGLPLGSASDTVYYTGQEMVKYQSSRNDCMATSRPTNTSVNYIIKAKIVSIPTDFMSRVDEVVEESMSDYQKKELSSGAMIEDVIPSDTSASNKLATQFNTVKRISYSITGTTDAIEDTKALVNHILTLGSGSYVGEFKRTGETFGSFRLTHFVDGDGTISVSGTVTYSISNNNDSTYQISYLLSYGSSTPYWNIEKLVVARENNFTYKVLTTDTDLNNVKASGTYSIYISDATSQTTNHAPVYGWLQLIVIQMNNAPAFCNQILYRDDVMFIRHCGNDVWSDWKQLAMRNEIISSHNISVPVASGTTFLTPFDALQYQLIHTDWAFLTSSDWNTASGGYELQGYYWGSYTATHIASNYILATGIITWSTKSHTFSAYYDATLATWKITINGEELLYNNNNIIIVRDALTEKRLFVRNIGETNIGALYSALDTFGLLGRPSIGIFNWTVQQTRTYSLGTPYNATHWTDTLTSGQDAYFQNPTIARIAGATSEWMLFWNDGNGYYACNMWGENNPTCTYISLEYCV